MPAAHKKESVNKVSKSETYTFSRHAQAANAQDSLLLQAITPQKSDIQ